MRNFRFIVMLVAVSLGAPALAAEEHFDIWLRPVAGRIVTGSITEGTPGDPISNQERVFGAELGEDPQFPFSAFEPGIQALPGLETAGMVYSFSITRALGMWNGGGFEDALQVMLIEFGPASATSGAGLVEGFSFTGAADGLVHDHFDFTLLDPAPSAGSGSPPGIYLLELSMRGQNGATTFESSLPFWIVFNLGQEEIEHDAAMQWVRDNLVPDPGGLVFMMLAMSMNARRRRE